MPNPALAKQWSTEFLAHSRVALDDLCAWVPERESSEVVFLVGSIPNGLATPASDVNLLVVGERRRSGDTGRTISPEGALAVKIKYYNTADVERIVDKMTTTTNLILKPADLIKLEAMTVETLNYPEIALLHDIRTGVPLANSPAAARWVEVARGLPVFMILFNVGLYTSRREDTVSQIQAGDALAALACACSMVDLLAAAWLATAGESNPDPKWRVTLLRRHANEIGRRRVDKLIDHLLLPGGPDTMARVKRALAFCDRVLARVFLRRPGLIPLMLEFRNRVKYVTHPDERPIVRWLQNKFFTIWMRVDRLVGSQS